MNLATMPDSIAALRETGEVLPPTLRASILSLGDDVVPALVALLEDDDLSMEDAPGDGWPPIHAVGLLAELKAEEAIAPMLRILRESDWETIIYNKVAVSLSKLGPVALEPVLAALEDADSDCFGSLCEVLAQLGVHDDRIFDALCDLFDENALLASICLADYGDARALPMLEGAIMDFVPDWASPLGVRDLVDFIDAYETLAGALPEPIAAHVERLRSEWSRRHAETDGARSPKIGRNDPCPCASGKKYKKCCLGKPLPA